MRERCIKWALELLDGEIDVPAFFVNTMILLKTMEYSVGQCGTLYTLSINVWGSTYPYDKIYLPRLWL